MSPVRLSGQDAYFLYRETAGALMHTLKIAVCEPPDPPLDRSIARVRSGSSGSSKGSPGVASRTC